MILLLHKEQQEIVDLVWDLDICQIKFYLHRWLSVPFSEAVARRCSVKKVFLVIHKFYKEAPVLEFFLIKLQAFCGASEYFMKALFCRTPANDCFWN